MQIPGDRFGEELTRDGRYALFRGRGPAAAPVLLKFPVSPSPDPATVAALRREHELLTTLPVEGLARSLAFRPEPPALVLEDRGGVLLKTYLSSGRLEVDEFIVLAMGLTATLGELHRCRVTHRNLSPYTVLLDPATRRTALLDLSLASRLPHEEQAASPPEQLQGRLAYMSPEQTGRMNRVVDYRTDLYSLGATFYEMVTGRPPFSSDDPLELVHAHIARTPPSPAQADPRVPEAVSRIIMRLLAKTAEGRYQSAWGLRADLEECARHRARTGSIPPFPLGTRDVSDQFTLPQHLYGRQEEVAALLEAFESSCGGRASLMLVAGYSGVGKTSLVHEVHKPIARRKGRFLWGKFDLLERGVPYGALLQAFRGLVRQLLAESEPRMAATRERLLGALGANAGVLCGVIPDLDLLLGVQPPPPPLPPAESQNRFNYAFESFLAVFAGREHPLAVFLDDLQWADSASLQLVARLLTNPDVSDLFLIGAYRDNEIAPDHPLMKLAAEAREAGAVVRRIDLPPLRPEDLEALVGDALAAAPAEARPLSDLVGQKTGGNPFFVTQFLRSLHKEGLIEFDHAARRWRFDLARIAQAEITDNVVDLMTRKLLRLAQPTREAITLAACVGSRFGLDVLAVVRQKPHREAAAELWPAIEEGLLLPTTEGYEPLALTSEDVLRRFPPSYRFLHDRVRQAAYELIPEDQRRPVHLRVGRLLLTQGHPDPPEDLLFEIVNHLNYAGDLVTDPDERIGLLRLNLRAGHKAKESAAFAAALDYFQRGLRLLPEDGWETHYDLALALTMQVAEGEYLCGRFAAAEERFETLLRRARTPLQKAEAERMRIMQYDSLARYAEALRAGREGLTRLGVALPEDAAEAERALDRELALIQAGLADRPIASLQHLPEMQDAETRMVVALSTAVWASAYILGHRGLASLLSARIVRASLEHGNTADSAYGYVTHAIAVGPFRGDYGSAYEWGALALRVNEALGDKKGRARVQQQFHAHVNLWRRPLATCLPHAREACRSGLETGDFTYAGYGAFTETWAAFFTSRDLERFIREYEPTVALLQRIRRSTLASAQQLFLAWAKALQGRTRGPLSLSHAGFDEDRYASAHREDPFCLTFLHAARLHLGVTFEDPVFALEAARRARAEAWQAEGTLWPVFQSFWRGLALAALHGRATASEGRASRAEIESTLDSLRVLEDNCAENFRLFRLLLEAEARRLGSSPAQAADLLEEAIAWAKRTDNLQGEALANELAARLWLTRGRDALAAAYLGEARRAYLSWGATAKADELRARHPHLLGAAAAATAPSSESVPLDMATVLKAARALAVNIDLRGLLRELMRIALENAGAQRAVFIQEREGRLCVEAEADAEGGEPRVLRSLPLEQAGGVSPGVVRYVHRTGQEVVLGEAATDDRFAADAYIARCAPRSVLCAPVVNHGRTAGILYLENSLTSHAFTARRVEIMQVLTAEAAIALDNARLYEGMKEEVARRRQAEEALRAALGELEKVKDRLEAENVYLQEEIRTQHNFEEIVGNSPALVATLHQVERVAPTGSSVLIYGETGTGKELVARAIHSRSARRDRPLVKVNCGAIAPGLVESELFGHVKGAFTGALQSRAGRFALADRGTIFLDEVSELPPDTQVKLLRVLQEQEFEPVGSPRTVRVDVRVIAASNRRLDEAVQNGSFRADLLYRLNVFPLEVPPLRDRRADLPLLVAFFVARLAKTLGKPLEGVSRRSMERLLAYAWPGNVRELQNVIERAAILAPGPLIEIDPLSSAGPPDGEAGPRTIEVVEREHIARALRSTRGVIEGPRGAASILGLHPNTLRSRMKRLGVDRRADESP